MSDLYKSKFEDLSKHIFDLTVDEASISRFMTSEILNSRMLR
jgi:hypothetical protein